MRRCVGAGGGFEERSAVVGCFNLLLPGGQKEKKKSAEEP